MHYCGVGSSDFWSSVMLCGLHFSSFFFPNQDSYYTVESCECVGVHWIRMIILSCVLCVLLILGPSFIYAWFRKHVWDNYCLTHHNEKLIEDNSTLSSYGVRNNSKVCFSPHVMSRVHRKHSRRRKHRFFHGLSRKANPALWFVSYIGAKLVPSRNKCIVTIILVSSMVISETWSRLGLYVWV